MNVRHPLGENFSTVPEAPVLEALQSVCFAAQKTLIQHYASHWEAIAFDDMRPYPSLRIANRLLRRLQDVDDLIQRYAAAVEKTFLPTPSRDEHPTDESIPF